MSVEILKHNENTGFDQDAVGLRSVVGSREFEAICAIDGKMNDGDGRRLSN